MATFQYGVTVYIVPVIDIEPYDVATVCHQVDGTFITQAEYPVYDFMLDVFNGTDIGSFVHEGLDFFFGTALCDDLMFRILTTPSVVALSSHTNGATTLLSTCMGKARSEERRVGKECGSTWR